MKNLEQTADEFEPNKASSDRGRELKAGAAPQPSSSGDSLAATSAGADDSPGEAVPADLDAELDNDLIGNRLDIYRIYSLLGSGGMGRVYLGWNERLQRLSAIKVASQSLIERHPERLELFLGEARSAARVLHPNIITVYTLGVDRGHHFIEMEYVDGQSLRGLIKERGPLSQLAAVELLEQIASALATAHKQRLIHCDVKPDNVMVNQTGTLAKLGDFGLARAHQTDAANQRLVGTPLYMAPELLVGGMPSTESDVYALGATAYVMLTGRVPFAAHSIPELIELQRRTSSEQLWVNLDQLSPDLKSLVDALLARNPLDRPVCDEALLEQIREIGQSIRSLPEIFEAGLTGLAVRWDQPNPVVESFRFVVELPAGRHQTVFADVIDATEDLDAIDEPPGAPRRNLVTFWTPCAPAKLEDFSYVLHLNSRLPFGAIGIHNYLGKPYFVMVQNQSRRSLDPEEVRTTVLHLAHWADLVEHKLTGSDVH